MTSKAYLPSLPPRDSPAAAAWEEASMMVRMDARQHATCHGQYNELQVVQTLLRSSCVACG